MKTRPLITICLLAGLMMLAACHDKPVQEQATQTKAMTRPDQGMVSLGKPMAPVRTEYKLTKDIQVGIPVVISLSISPTIDADQITLRYRTSDGLISGDSQQVFQFGSTSANTTLHQDITVIPQSEGRFRVILSVMIANPHGHAGSRSMRIPIVVGNPPPAITKPESKINKDTQGHDIEVTPAQEEIIRH